MCRVLAYVGPELPLASLLLEPENSLINQSLDPERHPHLQLAGWGFAAYGEHMCKPETPLIYRRPTAAFHDDNVPGIVPSLQASTMLAHVRAAAYDSKTVLADENCHPFSFTGTPWIIAQNGNLANWQLLQRELLKHCKDKFLKQMKGTTDTEFLYVLLLSLLKGNSDDEVQEGFETMLKLIVQAMKTLELGALNKLKIALVAPNRIIGVNCGTGHKGELEVKGDWKALRKSDPDSDDYALSMLLEPMYLLTGRNYLKHKKSYEVDACPDAEATSAIFASEALTEKDEEWMRIEFGELVAIERQGETITKRVKQMNL
ncbi:MAG: class II glutamine amidotransferase [unclassified Hahellaceae]|nr:class II glutamine amidotransferase [Hahellaceae bacterium]|tara:strand:- start:1000 stop:1950 length:951 start_codon:yes stop_codon:yes gene_type:complete